LSIARGIVELHRGSIEITSNQPSGACVVVSLPDPQDRTT
jgi:signal transduction histidine kinase